LGQHAATKSDCGHAWYLTSHPAARNHKAQQLDGTHSDPKQRMSGFYVVDDAALGSVLLNQKVYPGVCLARILAWAGPGNMLI